MLIRCLSLVVMSIGSIMYAAENARQWMPNAEDATNVWWVDGPPKIFNSSVKPKQHLLCFQYGNEKLLFDTQDVKPLDQPWECLIVDRGRRFRCFGLRDVTDEFYQPVRFVECGVCFHRVQLAGLVFKDASGEVLETSANLEVSIWPNRLAFRLYTESSAELELRFRDQVVRGNQSILLEVGEEKSTAVVESDLPLSFHADLGCHQLNLPENPWSNRAGTYYPEEHLDHVDQYRIRIRNNSDQPTFARLVFTQTNHLPITGFTPLLCDIDGSPTGIPIQLSKNWHQRPEKGPIEHQGPWFHGYTWLRVPAKSSREFLIRMVYAKYGDHFSASVSQLSLIGWGHNQFWDQAAVGSFGESICFEPGRIQRRCFITDVRPLLTLPHDPAGAKPWGWADNAGGGDLLMWYDDANTYQPLKATRTQYRAYGPCLTDVGYYEVTQGDEIRSRVDISVPGANDHLRTFIHLRYDVTKPIEWTRLAFFQLGADYYNDVPARKVAIGNADGLKEEWVPPRANGKYDGSSRPLPGQSPWISIHGIDHNDLKKGTAAANRGLIIRTWQARLGGMTVGPHLATYCTEWGKGNFRTAIELAPPTGLSQLSPGDFVEADLELVVFPAAGRDYYGPDENFRQALNESADSWRLVFREAKMNLLKTLVKGGTIERPYPLVVSTSGNAPVDVRIEGGVGAIPVTFTQMDDPQRYQVTVDGQLMKHWQTDWDAAHQQWRMTTLLPATGDGALNLQLRRKP